MTARPLARMRATRPRAWALCLSSAALAACAATRAAPPAPEPPVAGAAVEAAPSKPAEKPASETAAPQLPRAAAQVPDRDLEKLILTIECDPEEGPAPLEVKFNVEVDEDLEDPEYTWEFDDGTPVSREPSPVHVFEKPDLYLITVTVRDRATGLYGTENDIVDVTP